jgi:hypothetical protein
MFSRIKLKKNNGKINEKSGDVCKFNNTHLCNIHVKEEIAKEIRNNENERKIQ